MRIRYRLGLALLAATANPARAQCPDGTPPPCAARAAPPSNSVAVLIFENRARDTSLTLLAEGLADEITTRLGHVARLDVRSAASVRVVLANGAREPRRLGQLLGVRYLVDGALLSARGAVRANVELIDVTRRGVRWTNVYQRPTDDLFGVITSIADSVAAGIVGELTPVERASRAALPTRSSTAYEAYLRGMAALHRWDEMSVRRAVDLLDEAASLDSNFTAAWAGLSEAWQWSESWVPARVIFPRARLAAERALLLDSVNAPALAALAGVTLFYDRDPARAERLARHALLASPAWPRAHLYLGESLLQQGKLEEALQELRATLAADTLDEMVAAQTVVDVAATGAFDAALAIVRRWRAIEPGSSLWASMDLYTRLAQGRCRPSDVPTVLDQTATWLQLRAGLCLRGNRATRAYVDSAVADAQRSGRLLGADAIAEFYALVGDRGSALDWLARAIEEYASGVPDLGIAPWFANVRADPHFIEVWRRTGLPLPAAN